ncbi:MAG TPA: hypothetical protein VKX39_07165 [Bryobacteraceae bacterium]|nr:hypothetical protein [Bryobacteraceae bacterium]
MARGWESKSVEDQIQLASSRVSAARAAAARKQPTAQQLEIERKRDSLLLQRRRVLRDLETCTSERYRKTLESGLAYLESQLELLGARETN